MAREGRRELRRARRRTSTPARPASCCSCQTQHLNPSHFGGLDLVGALLRTRAPAAARPGSTRTLGTRSSARHRTSPSPSSLSPTPCTPRASRRQRGRTSSRSRRATTAASRSTSGPTGSDDCAGRRGRRRHGYAIQALIAAGDRVGKPRAGLAGSAAQHKTAAGRRRRGRSDANSTAIAVEALLAAHRRTPSRRVAAGQQLRLRQSRRDARCGHVPGKQVRRRQRAAGDQSGRRGPGRQGAGSVDKNGAHAATPVLVLPDAPPQEELARSSMSPRRLALLLSVAVAAASAASARPRRGRGAPARAQICVALVVDARHARRDGVSTSCATVSKGATGVDVLQAAGHSVAFRSDGLICTIDGLPRGGCAAVDASHYWAYFHRAPARRAGSTAGRPVDVPTGEHRRPRAGCGTTARSLTPKNVPYSQICKRPKRRRPAPPARRRTRSHRPDTSPRRASPSAPPCRRDRHLGTDRGRQPSPSAAVTGGTSRHARRQ